MDRAMTTNPNRLRLRLIALAALAPLAGAAAAASPKFSVELVGGRIKGDDTLKVRQGDQVQISVVSDQPLVLHLHGYDIEAQVTPPAPALLSFKASLAGRFPVHEHRHGPGNHRAVMFIEVHP
ncbi:hypothetical protein SAMN05443579_107392 [Variovorax sp. PDC80]|jgi:hypothetical protein|nr:MAG: hypothetical protein GAK39_02121 [Variovorax sp.]SFO97385.1 hypothetical protein SAMN05443579_107392 [Variovorax sp. PDC80]